VLITFLFPSCYTSYAHACSLDLLVDISEGQTNMFMSPAIAPDELLRKFPPTNVMCGGMDPLLDDAVDFHGRLVRVGVPSSLKIYRTMPHGFLSMDLFFRDAHRANTQLCWWINRMFAQEAQPRG
jgi:acetyl esterase/lipase